MFHSKKAGSQKAIINVSNLIKKYGDFTAVDGISFTVNHGEIFGILGPNGAGKTTTLEIMETLKPLTKGEVKKMKLLLLSLSRIVIPSVSEKVFSLMLQSPHLFHWNNIDQGHTGCLLFSLT